MPAPDRTSSAAHESYLASLESALRELPPEERREIALETRSHVAHRSQRDSRIATLLILLAFAKVLEPYATGLYISTVGGHRNLNFVISNPDHNGREVLGYWLVVVPVILATIIHFLVSRLLRSFVRKPRVPS